MNPNSLHCAEGRTSTQLSVVVDSERGEAPAKWPGPPRLPIGSTCWPLDQATKSLVCLAVDIDGEHARQRCS